MEISNSNEKHKDAEKSNIEKSGKPQNSPISKLKNKVHST